MQWKNSEDRYGLVSIVLHWVLAFLMVGGFVTGEWSEDVHTGWDDWVQAFYLHSNFVVPATLLIAFRVFWRMGDPRPIPIGNPPGWQKIAHALTVAALVTSMIWLPITGIVSASTAGVPIGAFGVRAYLPVSANDAIHWFASELHEFFSLLFFAAVIVHLMGTVKHTLIDRDHTLRRMLGF